MKYCLSLLCLQWTVFVQVQDLNSPWRNKLIYSKSGFSSPLPGFVLFWCLIAWDLESIIVPNPQQKFCLWQLVSSTCLKLPKISLETIVPAGRKSNRLEPFCKRFFPNYSQLFEINNNSLDMTEMQPTLGKETLGLFFLLLLSHWDGFFCLTLLPNRNQPQRSMWWQQTCSGYS